MLTGVLPQILKLHEYFHSTTRPIIFTQHGHTKEDLTPPYPNQLVRRWGPEGSIARGSSQADFVPAIKALVTSDSLFVHKNTYDAFINTNLTSLLDERRIERLVICGVMRDCCCDTTARSAFNRSYETWLVSDACGSANKTQHQAGLKGFGFMADGVMMTKR